MSETSGTAATENPRNLVSVSGHGQGHSLMLVGDYPDKYDLQGGKALHGYTGSMLGRYLRENDYNINQAWKTLVLKGEQNKEDIARFLKFKNKKVAFECDGMEAYEAILVEELQKMAPRVIMAVGEIPLNFLTGEFGIRAFRGSVLTLKPTLQLKTGLYETLVVPVLHPRDLQKTPSATVYTQFDVGRAVKYLSQRWLNPSTKYNIWVCKSSAELKDFLNRQFYKGEFYTTDIETFNNFITCAGLCFDGREAISVPLLDYKIPLEERAKMLRLLIKVWESDKPVVNQNIKYDAWILEYFGMHYGNILDDTMLLAHSQYPELPKGLDFLTSIHTEIPYYKDEGKEFDPAMHKSDQLYLYNAKDCLADHLVYQSQREDAKGTQVWPGYTVWDFHREKVWPCFNVYRDLEKTGIRIDPVAVEVLLTKYSAILDGVVADIDTALGRPFLINSPHQCAEILYDILKLPKQYTMRKMKDGSRKKTVSSDEEAMEELVLNHIPKQYHWPEENRESAKSLLHSIILCRKIYKGIQFLSTPWHDDGRMRTAVKQTGTESGRTSGSETVDYIWELIKGEPEQTKLGYSFQTVPKHGKTLPDGTKILDDLTTIFVPDDGYVFLEGDKSQAEARVVCVLADDYDSLPMFDKPNDIHMLTTFWITGVPYEELLKLKKTDGSVMYQGKLMKVNDLRQNLGKPGRHAGNFDMGDGELSHMAHIPIEEAKMILNRFHDNSPKIRNVFHALVREILTKVGVLVSPHGRRRDFFGRRDTNTTAKKAFSFIPQATISDHVKFDIMKPMWEEFRKKQVYFHNERHDSLLLSAPRSMVPEVSEAFIKYGATPIDFSKCSILRPTPLVVPTDMNWSDTNWHEMRGMKEWKN